MRQRASTKTQRRLKQQQQRRDPYALTDDVYSETPTFRVGGLVTAVGVLQLVAAMTLGGFLFGSALIFCAVLLTTLGLALLHHSDPTGVKQGLGLKQAISRLLALRRSALDYSLTLSIAQSQEYQQQTQKKELQIAVVPSCPTPQKVVATMAMNQETKQSRKPAPLTGNAPLVTLKRMDMTPLPMINSFSLEITDELHVEKPRAHSEPKQVLRSRPLLPLKPKVKQLGPVQEKAQEMTPSVLSKTLEKKRQVQTKTQPKPKPQPLRKKAEPKLPKVAAKTEVQTRAVLPKAEPKVVVPMVVSKAKVFAEPKPKPLEVAPLSTTVIHELVKPAIAPLPVFPEVKPLVEVARGEPAMEREIVVSRKVLLYLSPEDESMMDLEEQEKEKERELELEDALEDFALSLEAFPPLSPTMVPQAPMSLPAADVAEPNFLMDIELEPMSKPGNKLISLGSLRLKPVANADLRLMLGELDVMRLELDAAMARCTLMLNGDEEKVSGHRTEELEPEEEPIFCC